jgi:hypothetical protein
MEKSHFRWTTGAGLMLAPVLLAHPMQGMHHSSLAGIAGLSDERSL